MHKNFTANSAGQYLEKYSGALSEGLAKVDSAQLDKALKMIRGASDRGSKIFVAGNGGSAAISNHLCCDWTKGTFKEKSPRIHTHSLAANSSLLTALANDSGYENVFSEQIRMLASKGDVLLLISSSGNSPNIIKAARLARELGVSTVALTGFSGGEVSSHVDVHLHIPIDNYGVVEDAHQAIMHVMAQFISCER